MVLRASYVNDRSDGLVGEFVVKQPERPVSDSGEVEVIRMRREYYTILQDWGSSPAMEQWLNHVHSTMK